MHWRQVTSRALDVWLTLGKSGRLLAYSCSHELLGFGFIAMSRAMTFFGDRVAGALVECSPLEAKAAARPGPTAWRADAKESTGPSLHTWGRALLERISGQRTPNIWLETPVQLFVLDEKGPFVRRLFFGYFS